MRKWTLMMCAALIGCGGSNDGVSPLPVDGGPAKPDAPAEADASTTDVADE